MQAEAGGTPEARGAALPCPAPREDERLTFCCGDLPTREVVQLLSRRLALPPDVAGGFEIVLSEALNNVADHAYRGRPGGPVEVICRLEDDNRLVVEIVDEGPALPTEGPVAQPLPGPEVPRAALPERGFGWHLIRGLTDRVSLQRRDGRTHLRMELRLDQPGGSA